MVCDVEVHVCGVEVHDGGAHDVSSSDVDGEGHDDGEEGE